MKVSWLTVRIRYTLLLVILDCQLIFCPADSIQLARKEGGRTLFGCKTCDNIKPTKKSNILLHLKRKEHWAKVRQPSGHSRPRQPLANVTNRLTGTEDVLANLFEPEASPTADDGLGALFASGNSFLSGKSAPSLLEQSVFHAHGSLPYYGLQHNAPRPSGDLSQLALPGQSELPTPQMMILLKVRMFPLTTQCCTFAVLKLTKHLAFIIDRRSVDKSTKGTVPRNEDSPFYPFPSRTVCIQGQGLYDDTIAETVDLVFSLSCSTPLRTHLTEACQDIFWTTS